MFCTCHALVLNNIPLADLLWLCELDEMKGLQIRNSYRRVESATVFIKSIADEKFQRLSKYYLIKYVSV